MSTTPDATASARWIPAFAGNNLFVNSGILPEFAFRHFLESFPWPSRSRVSVCEVESPALGAQRSMRCPGN
jgi:hypothetical protein